MTNAAALAAPGHGPGHYCNIPNERLPLHVVVKTPWVNPEPVVEYVLEEAL